MIITTIFVVAIFSFVVVVVIIESNAYTQSNQVLERQQQNSISEVNMTDKMKYLCLEIDVKGGNELIEDKEQQAQCKKFLDKVSIYEMKELIDKYLGIEGN
jgi:hypothetical protein